MIDVSICVTNTSFNRSEVSHSGSTIFLVSEFMRVIHVINNYLGAMLSYYYIRYATASFGLWRWLIDR